MIVVDASVAVKVYVEEAGSEAATTLLTGEQRLLAPELIRLEVAGALCRRVRNREFSAEEAGACCEHWLEQLRKGLVALTPDIELLPEAIALANTLPHGLADCLYLTLARRFEAPLLTADRRFQERAVSVYPRISLLAGCENN